MDYSGGTVSASRPIMQFSIVPIKPVSAVVNVPTCSGITTGNTNTVSFSSVVNPSCLPLSVGDLRYSVNGGATWQASNTFTNLAPGVYNWAIKYANTPVQAQFILRGTFGMTALPTVTGPTTMCVGTTIDLVGLGELDVSALPTGGNSIYTDVATNRRIHIFNQSGTFTNNTSTDLWGVNVLIVGGGGGGGQRHAGGGGGGGVVYQEQVAVTTGAHTVSVGNGGVGGGRGVVAGYAGDGGAYNGTNVGGRGGIGQSSSFDSGSIVFTALGGGGGAANENGPGFSGGSGGGGSNATSGAIGTFGQGNRGGSHYSNHASGCGGGGAGGPAANSPNPIGGTPGGLGRFINITGTNVAYAGGGGGGSNLATGGFLGGSGVGGTGGGRGTASNGDNTLAGGNSAENNSRMGGNGMANRGGGGGGGGAWDNTPNGHGNSGKGGHGGSGVVIVSYELPTYSTSNPTVASVNPTTGVVTGLSAGTVVITYATPAGCVVTHTVTVSAPAGNPADFGTNTWNVYGFNGNNTTITSNDYRGRYIQPAIPNDFGVNSQLFWGINDSPSLAGSTPNSGNLWNGCVVNNDTHTLISKRRGFPCGTYQINPTEWDDRTEIYLNGAQIWACNEWYGANTCAPGTIGNFELNANSELEIRTFEGGGGSVQWVQVRPVYLGLSGTAARECPVSGNQMIDFVDPTGHLIASLNPQNNLNGVIRIESYVGAPNAMNACDMPTNELYRTAFMGRNWVVRLQSGSITGNVLLRLPYLDSELAALVTASSSPSGLSPNNPTDNVATAANLVATKYSGPVEDGIVSNNCGSGSSLVLNQVGSGSLNVAPYNFATAKFVSFTMNSFSEFYLHGSSVNSPLPVELVSFSGTCEDDHITLYWQTASEFNNDYFTIQQSRDLVNWESIGSVKGAGNSSQLVNYQFVASSFDHVYFRLIQTDLNGDSEVFSPVFIACDSDKNQINVFPNPSTSTFSILIQTVKNGSEMQLSLIDLVGKQIEIQEMKLQQGISMFHVGSDLSVGTYFISILIDGDQKVFKVEKL